MTTGERDAALRIWTARVKMMSGDPNAARRVTEFYASSSAHNQEVERRVLVVANE